MKREDFKKISEYLWEIPKTFRKDMLVPARVYASESMLEDMMRDQTLEQLVNTSTLPGVQKYVMVMPDGHEGYGAAIGNVFGTDAETGIISPGAVGYDQGCGIRILISNLTAEDVKPKLDALATDIQKEVPSGLGRGRQLKFALPQIDRILEGGSKFLVG